MSKIKDSDFWKTCEALDCPMRLEMLSYLLQIETTEFPCIIEIADHYHISAAMVSTHLKKLAEVGLVASKMSERRRYYRAFATHPRAARVMTVLRPFLLSNPDEERMRAFLKYVHALSLERRLRLVRVLNQQPSLTLKELSARVDMPVPTIDRQLEELDRARIVDLNGQVCIPDAEPERTILFTSLE